MTETPIDSMSASPAAVAPDPKRWSILGVVIVAQLMVVLDASIVTIALPSAQHDLHISVANRQWVITAYTLAFGGLLLLGGRVADYGGRRRMFVLGLLGFAAASALGGSAVDQAMLFSARALQGVFAALMAPVALSILTITFQSNPGERAKAFGAYGAVSGAGAAIGVLAGGVLTQYASWRWCLLINVPIAVLAAVAARRLVHESKVIGKTGYDVPGAVLITVGVVSLVYGFTKAVSDGWTATQTLTFISVGVAFVVAFIVVEVRSAYPLLPMRIVLDRNRGGSFLATLLLIIGMFAMFLFVSYYMQTVLHYSAAKAGVAFLPFALGVIFAAGASTPLVPKLGPRIVMTVGLLIAAAGLLWLTQIGVHTSYWTHLFLPQIVMSIGMGLAFPALSSASLTNVAESDAGVASSVLNAAQQVGASVGAALLNTIAATATATYLAVHGATFATNAIVHGYTRAFAVGAAILAAGAIVSAVFLTSPAKVQSNPAVAHAIGEV